MKGPVAVAAFAALGAVGFAIARRRGGGNEAHRLLGSNYGVLSERHQRDASALASSGHQHLLTGWPPPGKRDTDKVKLLTAARSFLDGTGSAADLEQQRQALLEPPQAEQRAKTLQDPDGKTREDPWYWLRDDERQDPAMISYLEAENKYVESVMADTKDLQKKLVAELRARIQEADETAPVRRNGYYYYQRTEEGKQYEVHCRRKVTDTSKPHSAGMSENAGREEVVLDENKEAKPHKFYMTGGLSVSPDTKLLAYGVDTSGAEKYDIQVRDLHTGKDILKQPIKNTDGGVVWAKDSRTFLYTTKQPKILRTDKVWRHTIGSPPEEDKMVFHEPDESYNVHTGKSRDGNYLLISTGSTVTSDVRYCPADNPAGTFKLVLPRQHDVEYDAEPRGDHFFIEVRDKQRPNREVLVAPIDTPTRTQPYVKHRDDVCIEGFEVAQDFLTVRSRKNGLQMMTVYKLPGSLGMPRETGSGQDLRFEEPAYSLGGARQGDFDSPVLRFTYSSLSTPTSWLEQDMATGSRRTVKETPVLGGFDRSHYQVERRWATASDGARIPLSMVWRKGKAKLDGSDPMLLYGYGSYEICINPGFRRNDISLIDRGFIYVIAHIRGGGEMGRQWYENGKFLHKKNTFTDFIAAAEYLIKEKLTQPSKICIEGRSAGGLLMGAVLNMRPDLFSAALAGVPFVDVVTTMLDDSIPLTTGEWEEWGNPAEQKYYDYMLSYSPVDQVAKQAYPHILVTSGLNDPRVAYWEPAKWVAKLRQLSTSSNMLIHKCNMGAGHFSESGRFDRLGETALEYAFLLKVQGLLEQEA